jgi:hypothetical protein
MLTMAGPHDGRVSDRLSYAILFIGQFGDWSLRIGEYL